MNVKMDDKFTFSECVQLSDPKIELLFKIRFGEYGEDDPSVELVRKSKVGKISIKKISGNSGYLNSEDTFSGITANFGEGMGVYISDTTEWYNTSVIQHIDWENNQFTTCNSTYSFQFEEMTEETLNQIRDYYGNSSN